MHPLLKVYQQTNKFGLANGMVVKELNNGSVRYEMTIREEHLATPNVAHGGALAGYMDAILGVTALGAVVEKDQLVSTIEFKIDYLRPAFLNEVLIGKGTIIHQGKRILRVQAAVYNNREEIIVTGTGSFNAYNAKNSDAYKLLKN